MTLVAAGTVVLADRVCRPGWVETAGELIVGCGSGSPPRQSDIDFPSGTIVPGFVDIHVHGGGGASLTDGSTTEIARAVEFHRRHGTTTTLASLVSAHPTELLDAMRPLVELTRSGLIAGMHLEGPWLSGARCGAHDPTALRAADTAEVERIIEAGDGAIRMVTLAPELPGALDAITRLTDAGIVVAVGHTEATYHQTRDAIDHGARVGTHLFNAMRGLHHREPGPAMALLEDPRVTVELIADGVHLHSALIRHVVETAGPERVALVTDAMAAAGMADGSFRLGTLEVDVVDGVAKVAGTQTIAGSTATMDQVFRAVVGDGSDEALAAAVAMTSSTPARAVGIENVGTLRSGCRADLVVLGEMLAVKRVMVGGGWVWG